MSLSYTSYLVAKMSLICRHSHSLPSLPAKFIRLLPPFFPILPTISLFVQRPPAVLRPPVHSLLLKTIVVSVQRKPGKPSSLDETPMILCVLKTKVIKIRNGVYNGRNMHVKGVFQEGKVLEYISGRMSMVISFVEQRVVVTTNPIGRNTAQINADTTRSATSGISVQRSPPSMNLISTMMAVKTTTSSNLALCLPILVLPTPRLPFPTFHLCSPIPRTSLITGRVPILPPLIYAAFMLHKIRMTIPFTSMTTSMI